MSALSWDGIASAWSASRKSFRLRAPIGLMAGGEPLEIDLRRDGPHGLIAGTTGSGKSEFLQTLIVSMAARIPPDLLNFLLIDYKGGSAFEQIKTLPHVVGMVTDLDERLATRALTSLRAELHRREKLFASTKPAVENIAEYQKTARAVPLANVVIIIDEFHRLVSEQPDFIDQIVRIAQQGRSLGVHLLLATQKPSGVVNDHIRANTPLRICLRVTDDADSRDVLGVVDAARIPKELPGRVYVKVGSEEPIAAQTARTSGEIELPSQTGSVSVNWFIRPLRRGVKSGEVVVWPVTATPRSTDSTTIVEHADGRTALVQSICRAATERPIPKQLAPWALPLPESLALASLETAAAAAGPVIGLLDEPELQRQRPLELDLGAGHVLVAGGANTGKTTALLTMAQALAAVKGPAQLHVYGIDFGGGGLGPLMQLAHCGGVARQYDNPSLGWLLGALGEIVAARSAQGPARAGDWPQVLVVVDNFIGLSTSLESWEDPGAPNDLLEIMEVGRSVGVSFVLSAERPEAIRAGVMATLGTRLVLPLADSTGYGALGMWHAHSSGEPIAGRAILADGVGHEVQIALPGPWEGLVGSAVADGPLRISPLPTVVAVSDVAARVDPSEKNLVLGLKDGTDSLFRYSAEEHLLVLGPRGAGRSNALLVALAEARRIGATAWVWNTRRSVCLARFSPQGIPDKQVQYAEPQTGQTAWAELKAEVATRMAALEKGGGSAFKPMLVVIDDADAVDLPTPEAEMMGSLVLGGPDLRITLAVAMSTQALRTKAPYDWRRTLLSLKRGILLSPQAVQDYEHFDVRGRPQRMPKGRGFVCSDGTKHLVQIALADS
jgi:S-DNA-T family DNA segregation ATPase FtsK/SpoIIIE